MQHLACPCGERGWLLPSERTTHTACVRLPHSYARVRSQAPQPPASAPTPHLESKVGAQRCVTHHAVLWQVQDLRGSHAEGADKVCRGYMSEAGKAVKEGCRTTGKCLESPRGALRV